MIRDTFARCHAVLYKGFDESVQGKQSRRIQKLALFRDLKEAMEFHQEKQKEGNAIQLFIEPPMRDGPFNSIDFQNEDDL